MNDLQIIRPRLAFEQEFGQHRNWWVRDSRIAGNPLSILLFLLSHDPQRIPTQTEARKQLGLGKDAWNSAKKRLLETGFIVEVRDRYPSGHLDSARRPKGGQKRYRLFIQDPEPGHLVSEDLAVVELDEPYEVFLKANQAGRAGLSDAAGKLPDQSRGGFSAVHGSPAADNPTPADNPTSFKEEKTGWLVGSTTSIDKPTNPTTGAHVAEVDAALASLHPALHLTYAQIFIEVGNRVDLNAIDVVQAVRDTVLKTAARGQSVRNPAALVASVIVRKPAEWLLSASRPQAFTTSTVEAEFGTAPRVDCVNGNHWWGAAGLDELDRSHCADCGQPRRDVDPAFAELELRLLSAAGDL